MLNFTCHRVAAALSKLSSPKARLASLVSFPTSKRTYFHHRFSHSEPHHHHAQQHTGSTEQASPRSQHQLHEITSQMRAIATHNQLLLREFETLKRELAEKESKSLCSWIDTNPFKFGVLCGTVVFMMIVTRLELKKNKMKVAQLREQLKELAQQKKLASYNGRAN